MPASIEIPKFIIPRKDRHGRVKYLYFRRKGKITRIKSSFPSDDFWVEYNSLVRGDIQKKETPVLEGSVQALVDEYKKSSHWRKLAKRTQDSYELPIRRLLKLWGHIQVAELTPRHVDLLLEKLENQIGASQADRTVVTLSTMISKIGTKRGYCKVNPAVNFERRRSNKDIKPTNHWPIEAVIALATLRVLPAEKAEFLAMRRVFWSAIFTAQRQGDLLSLSEDQWDQGNNCLHVTQGKTKKVLSLPILPLLAKLFNDRPNLAEHYQWVMQDRKERQRLVLFNQFGHGWDEHNFRKVFRKYRKRIDPENKYEFRGLRKSAPVILRTLGATLEQIQSITGHKTITMPAMYSAQHDQFRLAQSTMELFEKSEFMAQLDKSEAI